LHQKRRIAKALAGFGRKSNDSDTELKAIVETIHRMHRTVMAHALSAESIEAAVNAGVDSIEHGSYLNEETAKLMAQHHVFLDPTLYVLVAIQDAIDHPTPTIPMKEKNIRKFRTMTATAPSSAEKIALAKHFGLILLAGTDDSGPITDEVVALVEQGHLSPREALVASTINGAEAVHLSDQIGTLAPGKSADVIAFDGNPLTNIEDCHKLHFVMALSHVAVNPDTGEGDPTPASALPM
jgi:imidazolonepropionase-like amidohydrolase